MGFKPKRHLLASLAADKIAALLPHLKVLELPQETVLFETGDTIETVYFPLSGVVSVVVDLAAGVYPTMPFGFGYGLHRFSLSVGGAARRRDCRRSLHRGVEGEPAEPIWPTPLRSFWKPLSRSALEKLCSLPGFKLRASHQPFHCRRDPYRARPAESATVNGTSSSRRRIASSTLRSRGLWLPISLKVGVKLVGCCGRFQQIRPRNSRCSYPRLEVVQIRQQ
jgi:hypothetical protein